jgi:hypothetical protein
MSLFLSRGKTWRKVEGFVKVSHQNNLFITTPDQWIFKQTLVPFPLETSEKLEDIYSVYAEFDLNTRKVQKMTVLETKEVKISEITISNSKL